jgi:hypothetical protein
MSTDKELCDCGKIAIWCYGPGYMEGGNPNSCDDCVPRGCSCNHYSVDVNAYHPPLSASILPEGEEGVDWKWIAKDAVWANIDEKGREYPCCEYMYSEDGWDIEKDSNI